MVDLLQQLENMLEKALEDRLFSWLPEESSLADILRQMITVFQGEELLGNPAASLSDYLIRVSPDDYNTWFSNQADLMQISRILTAAMQSAGVQPAKPPAFHIIADGNIQKGSVAILPVQHQVSASETQNLGSESAEKLNLADTPVMEEIRAFFSGNSGEVFNLAQHVVNIGRREDNDIILADPRVSRHHAQIRRVRNSYVLFDLNSTGGTSVNNKPISQITLATGDVVSFAGVILIYGQEVVQSVMEETNDLNGSTHKPDSGPDSTGGLEIL